MNRLRTASLACVAALALFAFAGCGGGSPEDAVKDFYEAFADGDGEKACDLLAEDAKKGLGGECEQAISAFGGLIDDKAKDQLKDAEVSDVEEDGDNATAKVKIGDQEEEVKLKKEDGDWKVTGDFAGTTPTE